MFVNQLPVIFRSIFDTVETRPSVVSWVVAATLVATIFATLAFAGPNALHEISVRLPEPDSASSDVRVPVRIAPAVSSLRVAGKPDPLGTGALAINSATPFIYSGMQDERGRALECLAAAAWYEAGDDAVSQSSVIQVILNRVRHASFPNSICGVVFQGSDRVTGCQFTFTCDGSLLRRKPPAPAWERAKKLANAALLGAVDTSVMQATHYHADYVSPWWSSKLRQLSQVGRHIFYRWPGKRGVLPISSKYTGDAAFETFSLIERRPAETVELVQTEQVAASISEVRLIALPEVTIGTHVSVGGIVQGEISPAIIMKFDLAERNGRWAMSALDKCAGRKGCQVLGYESSEEVGRNRITKAAERARPLFLFIRDAATGMDIALWDCERVERPNAAQCMPEQGPALLQLMKERSD